MNNVILSGRLTADPKENYGDNGAISVVKFTLAVDDRKGREGDKKTNFISCVAFGKHAEFISKYYKQGTSIVAQGRISTGSYTNKDGVKVYTTDVVVETSEFGVGNKKSEEASVPAPAPIAQQPTQQYQQSAGQYQGQAPVQTVSQGQTVQQAPQQPVQTAPQQTQAGLQGQYQSAPVQQPVPAVHGFI